MVQKTKQKVVCPSCKRQQTLGGGLKTDVMKAMPDFQFKEDYRKKHAERIQELMTPEGRYKEISKMMREHDYEKDFKAVLPSLSSNKHYKDLDRDDVFPKWMALNQEAYVKRFSKEVDEKIKRKKTDNVKLRPTGYDKKLDDGKTRSMIRRGDKLMEEAERVNPVVERVVGSKPQKPRASFRPFG